MAFWIYWCFKTKIQCIKISLYTDCFLPRKSISIIKPTFSYHRSVSICRKFFYPSNQRKISRVGKKFNAIKSNKLSSIFWNLNKNINLMKFWFSQNFEHVFCQEKQVYAINWNLFSHHFLNFVSKITLIIYTMHWCYISWANKSEKREETVAGAYFETVVVKLQA